MIAMSGTASPNAPINDVLYINAIVAENPGRLRRNPVDPPESLQDGTGHATVNVRYALEAGKSYVFGAGFASNAPVSIRPGFCQGVGDDRANLSWR